MALEEPKMYSFIRKCMESRAVLSKDAVGVLLLESDRRDNIYDYIESEEFSRALDNLDTFIDEKYFNGECVFCLSRDHQRYLNDTLFFENPVLDFIEYLCNIDDRDYEYVCGYSLELLGYSNVTVTKATRDGGIDFYATHNICIGKKSERFMELQFLGQAKRYKNSVGIGDVRDFLGAVELLRCGAYRMKSKNSTHGQKNIKEIKPFGAHGLIMMASNRLTSDAKDFAELIGVRCIDGKELASIFHHYEVGFMRNESDVFFDASSFEAGLRKFKPSKQQ